ncbi:MAG: DUF3105 domain-containing protein [Parcubacteria group bacterium]|nr:DUF3105 domain-containing protein [Parcubacteria group bacterium]
MPQEKIAPPPTALPTSGLPSNADQTLTKAERRAQKAAARGREAKALRSQKVLRVATLWFVGLSVFIGGGWLLVTKSNPKGSDHSRAIPILGREHIQNGTVFEGYNSNPPTSGPHYPQPANAGFYDKELPDEQLVHNLEHGHVWIAYRPSLSQEVVGAIRKFAGGNVIVTPRSKNDADIALAAWGRLDAFNLEEGKIDTQRIRDFILRYRSRGPENISLSPHSR